MSAPTHPWLYPLLPWELLAVLHALRLAAERERELARWEDDGGAIAPARGAK